MVEFAPANQDGLYRQGFAGDSYNTAIYLARLGLSVQYLTRLGDDSLSDAILKRLGDEGVDTSLIEQSDGRQPGLYLIDNDASGEREFRYWRDSSPARELFDQPVNLQHLNAFYFSGITLAVCRSGLDNLLALLNTLRENDCQVVFDPNYRPALWRDKEQTRDHYRAVLPLCDMALPTLEDEAQLWGTDDVSACRELYQSFGIRELVIKSPNLTAHGFAQDSNVEIPTQTVMAIDTTGAGDAFNAGYLSKRLTGGSLPAAIKAAQALAAKVVRHKGAIIPRTETTEAGNI